MRPRVLEGTSAPPRLCGHCLPNPYPQPSHSSMYKLNNWRSRGQASFKQVITMLGNFNFLILDRISPTAYRSMLLPDCAATTYQTPTLNLAGLHPPTLEMQTTSISCKTCHAATAHAVASTSQHPISLFVFYAAAAPALANTWSTPSIWSGLCTAPLWYYPLLPFD